MPEKCDEDEVSGVPVDWFRKILADLQKLVIAGIDETCQFATDLERRCSAFVSDVGGVMLSDIKDIALSLGLSCEWVIPTIKELAVTVEDILGILLSRKPAAL